MRQGDKFRHVIASRNTSWNPAGHLCPQKRVHALHDLKCIGHVHHIRLAACPAAVGVEADRTPLADETPAHHVRLFAMAAGRESLRMPGRRTSLAHLIEMREKRQDRDPVAALIDK